MHCIPEKLGWPTESVALINVDIEWSYENYNGLLCSVVYEILDINNDVSFQVLPLITGGRLL